LEYRFVFKDWDLRNVMARRDVYDAILEVSEEVNEGRDGRAPRKKILLYVH
jgi:hypothetical protein